MQSSSQLKILVLQSAIILSIILMVDIQLAKDFEQQLLKLINFLLYLTEYKFILSKFL